MNRFANCPTEIRISQDHRPDLYEGNRNALSRLDTKSIADINYPHRCLCNGTISVMSKFPGDVLLLSFSFSCICRRLYVET